MVIKSLYEQLQKYFIERDRKHFYTTQSRKARAHSEEVAAPLASRLWPRSGPNSPSTLADEQGQRPLWCTSTQMHRLFGAKRLIDVVSKLLLLHGLEAPEIGSTCVTS